MALSSKDFKTKINPDFIWSEYQRGIQFKQQIGLYDTVTKNERYFAGDQWADVSATDLPKPPINFLKRACQQKISEVNGTNTSVVFSAIEFPDQVITDVSAAKAQLAQKFLPMMQQQQPQNTLPGVQPQENPVDDFVSQMSASSALLTAMFEADYERLNIDSINLDGLQDACISGDYILYNYWDGNAATGQKNKGQIAVERIDNVNYYPGNPNVVDPQKQPYIIVARREILSDVIAEAQANKVSAEDIQFLSADTDTQHQSGDMAKQELKNDDGKIITLVFMAKCSDTGTLFCIKSANGCTVRPLWDSKLTRYPISIMNWELRKNCCHGRAEITGLVPIQRYVNQMYAMAALHTMQNAVPKPIYNKSMIPKGWSTQIGAAIPVNGDINSAAKFLVPASIAAEALTLPEKLLRLTLEMMGVTDVSLGNINPTNTSAIIVARQASQIPIQTIQSRFYTMMKEFARNWLDMILVNYKNSRYVTIKDQRGQSIQWVFDPAEVKDKLWDVRVDVGAATVYSEMTTVQTLQNLLLQNKITLQEFLERLPDGYIPNREGIIKRLKDQPMLPEAQPQSNNPQYQALMGGTANASNQMPSMPSM